MTEGSIKSALTKRAEKSDAFIAGIFGLRMKGGKMQPANQHGILQGVKLLKKPTQQLHVFLDTKVIDRALAAGFA